MRELVQHEIVAVVRIRRPGLRVVPGQDERAEIALRMAGQMLLPLGPDPILGALVIRDVPARIHDHGR